MLYIATRRAKLWNIIAVAFVSCCSCLYTIDTYFVGNWQSRRQQQHVIHNEELQNHLYPMQQSDSSQSSMIASLGDKWSQNVSIISEHYGTVITNTFHKSEEFPRWKESIGLDELHRAIILSMSGKLRFDRAHRIYVVSEKGIIYHVNVPRPQQADQAPYRRARTMELFALEVLTYVKKTRKDDSERYQYLNAVLREGGFAYIANYADSRFCADQQPFISEKFVPLLNTNDTTVPVFTLSSPKIGRASCRERV